jgi:hypothetical protein
MQQSFDYGTGSGLGQRAHYAGEGGKRLRPPRVLGALRHLAGDHRRPQCPVELSEGIAPPAGLQNRACRRVGGQRVTLIGTFPTAPLRTARESFDLKQLSSDHFPENLG